MQSCPLLLMVVTKPKYKLRPKIKCITCKNNLQTVYLAKTGGNKEPIGLFCVHCDYPREPLEWFKELKFEKIKEAEEKRKYQNFDNKTCCPYCKKTNFIKDKDKFNYVSYPIYDKKTNKLKKIYQKEVSKITRYHCKNPKCKAETHKGIWAETKQLV